MAAAVLRSRGRRSTLLACALLTGGAPAWGSSRADLTQFVASIYTAYGKDGHGVDIHGRAAPSVLAPSLLALVRAEDRKAGGEDGVLDSDPLCACQDFEIDDVRPIVRHLSGATARVEVTFRNFKKAQSVTLSLVDTPAGWRISDISTRAIPSLAARLRKE